MNDSVQQQGKSTLMGTLSLLSAAAIWGLTFPLIRNALENIAPNYFVFLRFALTALLMLPFVLFNSKVRRELAPAAASGISLGLIIAVGYLAQTIGLQTVTSPRAAFITGTAVLIVPFLSPFFDRTFPRPVDWLSALVVTVGLYLLLEPQSGELSSGDLWIGLCAFSVALHIHLVKRLGKKQFHEVTLVFLQVIGVCIASLLTLPAVPALTVVWTPATIVGLLFCAIFATVIALYLQMRFQKQVSAECAAIIFSAEPVFATIFSYFLLGEGLDGRSLVGAGIIFFALVLNQAVPGRKKRRLVADATVEPASPLRTCPHKPASHA